MTAFWQTVDDAVAWNCAFLRLPSPTVRLAEPSELATPTVKCAASADGTRLIVNPTFAESGADEAVVWLAISHECRHIWQARYSDVLAAHRPLSELSVREYNAQAAEIDAWAWGAVVLSERFHARPTLEKTLGEDAWKQIDARARQIVTEALF